MSETTQKTRYTRHEILYTESTDCSIVVVCTHGVRVVRVRFPAVRQRGRHNPCCCLALKKDLLYNMPMKEEKQGKLWIPPFMMAAGVFLGWLLFGYNWHPEREERGSAQRWAAANQVQHQRREKEQPLDLQATREKQIAENLNEYEQRAAEIQNRILELQGSGDISFEQALIHDALGFADPRSKAVVTHQSGQFFKVDVRVPIEASPTGWGGGYAILKKEGDKYRALYKGQEPPRCDVVEEENIPNEIIESFSLPKCWDDEVGWRKPR